MHSFGAVISFLAIMGFAGSANAVATIDLLWGGTAQTLAPASTSTSVVLHIVLTADETVASSGGSVNVNYGAAGSDLTFVSFTNTTFTPPLPNQVGLTTDNGTTVTNINAVGLPPNQLEAGATFLLGTVTFFKGAGEGPYAVTSTGSIADNLGGVFDDAMFNSAFVPEPGPIVSLLAAASAVFGIRWVRRSR